MTFLAWVTGALLWLATSGTTLAFAQVAQPAPSAQDEEARALFEAGRVAYDDGRYADALGYFEHSFELSHRAALKYNLGLAYDRLRRDREALEAYEAYLETERDPNRSAEVENRVRALRASLAAEEAAQEKQKSESVSTAPVIPLHHTGPTNAERTRKRRLWIGIAAGVVAVGAGVAISVLASREGDDGRPKPNTGVVIESLSWH